MRWARPLCPWCFVALCSLRVLADDDLEQLEFYLGAGSFWSLQQTLNSAEEEVFGRSGGSITGIAGYAGGLDNGRPVCYIDYDQRGHAEVVSVKIPRQRLHEFLDAAWRSIFRGGERTDTSSEGGQYRNVIGIPGGYEGSPDLIEAINRVQGNPALALEQGHGDEGDTRGQRRIWVYDSRRLPFHQGELFQQFKRQWRYRSRSDQDLVEQVVAAGRLKETDCPPEWVVALVHPFVLGTIALLTGCCLCFCFRCMCRQHHQTMKAQSQIRPVGRDEAFSIRIINPPWQLQSILGQPTIATPDSPDD